MLRQVGIEPPKWHDVGGSLLAHGGRFDDDISPRLELLARISAWLRKERELAFYGDVDFIPTEEYSRDDAQRAIADAETVVATARQAIPLPAAGVPAESDPERL